MIKCTSDSILNNFASTVTKGEDLTRPCVISAIPLFQNTQPSGLNRTT